MCAQKLQPAPCEKPSSGVRAATRVRKASSSGGGSYGSRQCVQMRRTRRCATTADDRRRDQERLDAHVEQAVQRGDRVGRVQRREHEVPGERGLHGDARGLDVADLADEDHVRVLAKDRLAVRRRT